MHRRSFVLEVCKRSVVTLPLFCADAPRRKPVTMMGNKATTGPFAPLVVVVRGAIGEKPFNQLRGKAISLHSQSKILPHGLPFFLRGSERAYALDRLFRAGNEPCQGVIQRAATD
jgi:hypothetical protein